MNGIDNFYHDDIYQNYRNFAHEYIKYLTI